MNCAGALLECGPAPTWYPPVAHRWRPRAGSREAEHTVAAQRVGIEASQCICVRTVDSVAPIKLFREP